MDLNGTVELDKASMKSMESLLTLFYELTTRHESLEATHTSLDTERDHSSDGLPTQKSSQVTLVLLLMLLQLSSQRTKVLQSRLVGLSLTTEETPSQSTL
jgi:hypothetical protein